MKNMQEICSFRSPIGKITSQRNAGKTTENCRNIMWRKATSRLLSHRFLSWCRGLSKRGAINLHLRHRAILIPLQEKSNAAAVARIIAEKRPQQALCGYAAPTTPRARSTVRNLNRFPKKSCTLPAVKHLGFLNLTRIFFSLKLNRLLFLHRIS